jgi:hypothetical protein
MPTEFPEPSDEIERPPLAPEQEPDPDPDPEPVEPDTTDFPGTVAIPLP